MVAFVEKEEVGVAADTLAMLFVEDRNGRFIRVLVPQVELETARLTMDKLMRQKQAAEMMLELDRQMSTFFPRGGFCIDPGGAVKESTVFSTVIGY